MSLYLLYPMPGACSRGVLNGLEQAAMPHRETTVAMADRVAMAERPAPLSLGL